MTLNAKKSDHRVAFDLGRFWDGKVSFWSLRIAKPPFTKAISAESLGLKGSNNKVVRSVTKMSARFLCLPKARHDVFVKLANEARGIICQYRLDGFPFVASGTIPVSKETEDSMIAGLNEVYQKWVEEREKLALDIPALRESQMAKAAGAAEHLYSKNAGISESLYDFKRKFIAGFYSRFPSQKDIREGYTFDLISLGGIKKSVELMTSEDVVSDAETAAKLEVIQHAKKEMREQVLDWVAGQASFVRAELFKALFPVVDGLQTKRQSITPSLADRVRRKIERIQNLSIFKDASFASFCNEVQGLLKDTAEKSDEMSRVLSEFKLQEKMLGLQKEIEEATFTPETARLLELDSDEEPVFADPSLCADIAARMKAKMEEAAKEVAEKIGGTPEDIEKAERRARKAMALAEIAEATEGTAVEKEDAMEVAARFLELEIEEAKSGGAEAPNDPIGLPAKELDLSDADWEDLEAGVASAHDELQEAVNDRFSNIEL